MQPQRRRRHLLHIGLGDRNEARAPLGRGEIALGAQLGEQELTEGLRFAELALEAFVSVPAHIGVRVLALRQEEEADRLVVRGERQAHFQRPPGGLAAGGVTVEAEHHRIRQAQELGHMDRRSRRAERRDRIGDAVLRQRHDVHIAFDDQHLAGGANRIARVQQPVELAALLEERRLR